MSFAISAEFLCGSYRASEGEGQLDRWPSPARLHSAFLAAAGSGTRAVATEAGLSPRAEDLTALGWLEANPPDGLALPLQRVNRSRATAYRDLGLIGPGKVTRKVPKADSAEVALSDSVMWIWENGPPGDVAQALDDLSADIPYLGRADSPVRVSTLATPGSPTHVRVANPTLAGGRADDVDVVAPRRGRADALIRDHQGRMGESVPTPARDRVKTSNEVEFRNPVVPDALGIERYAKIRPDLPAETPWRTLWLLPITSGQEPITGPDRVRWAIALHRALVAVHGDGAPPMLTGHYAAGALRPPNRIAIHVVDVGPTVAPDLGDGQLFVLAVPQGADPREVSAVAEACERLTFVTSRGTRLELVAPAERPAPIAATEFWREPEPGTKRLWTSTPAIPDTRPQRGSTWTMADTVALSLALVHRDRFLDEHHRALRGTQRYRALADAALEAGVRVLKSRKLSDPDLTRYAHKIPDGLVVQPYVATLDLGDLGRGDRTWLAIGQSRHLGGGLLRPLDVDPAVVEVWSAR